MVLLVSKQFPENKSIIFTQLLMSQYSLSTLYVLQEEDARNYSSNLSRGMIKDKNSWMNWNNYLLKQYFRYGVELSLLLPLKMVEETPPEKIQEQERLIDMNFDSFFEQVVVDSVFGSESVIKLEEFQERVTALGLISVTNLRKLFNDFEKSVPVEE